MKEQPKTPDAPDPTPSQLPLKTKRFKRQHRLVAPDMSLKAWARYIAKGTSAWSGCASVWLARKAGAA